MLRRVGIRGRILAVVAVPALALLLVAGFVAWTSVQDFLRATESEQLVSTLGQARGLQDDLQTERRAAINYVHILIDSPDKLTSARQDTGSALSDVIGEAGAGSGVADQIADALGGTTNGDIFAQERSLSMSEAESGQWVEFPSADDSAAMQDGYAAAAQTIDDLAAEESGALAEDLTALAEQIRVEARYATSLFADAAEWRAVLEETYPAVDDQLAQLADRVDEFGDSTPEALTSLNDVGALSGGLADLRQSTRSGGVIVPTLTGFYNGMLDDLIGASEDVAVTMTDADMITRLRAFGDMDLLIENIAREGVLGERLIRTGEFARDGREVEVLRDQMLRTNISQEAAQASTVALEGVSNAPALGAELDFSEAEASFVEIRTTISAGIDFNLQQQDLGVWSQAVDDQASVYEPVRETVWTQVDTGATTATQNALIQAIVTGIVGALVVIASVVLALLIARRIVSPLRRLTAAATQVRVELPRLVDRVARPDHDVDVSHMQIPVESRDEIGQLADAFNGANETTLAIAGEQAALRASIAEMFVNVARRDQVLLNRQLSSIDEMERHEDDPETLTKLFSLDHLATRMRRNSESLLVLAGIDTGRRMRQAMPLSDVIRTASSEIELYERVTLELDADPAMVGHTALITAHMLAELLENATVFSDPNSPVAVRTSQRGDEYVVEIADAGIGMSAAELDDARRRIGSTAASEILGAQRLGMFVVGRIARRIGARVEINSTEGVGTVASVALPQSLFEEHGEDVAIPRSYGDGPFALPMPVQSLPDPARVSAEPPSAVPPSPAFAPAAYGDGTSAEHTEPVIVPTAGAVLPTRRVRGPVPEPTDPERDANAVIGIPTRATDAQLTQLEAASGARFAPALPADELVPQSPRERASMFRGFRPRRELEQHADEISDSAAEAGAASPSLAPDLPWEAPDPSGTSSQRAAAAAAGAASALGSRRAARLARHVDGDDAATGDLGHAVGLEPDVPGLADDRERAGGAPDVNDDLVSRPDAESSPLPVRPVAGDSVNRRPLFGQVSASPSPEAAVAADVSDSGLADLSAAAGADDVESVYQPQQTMPAPQQPASAWATVEAGGPVSPYDAAPGAGQEPPRLDDLISSAVAEEQSRPGFFSKLFRRADKAAPEPLVEPTPSFRGFDPVVSPQGSAESTEAAMAARATFDQLLATPPASEAAGGDPAGGGASDAVPWLSTEAATAPSALPAVSHQAALGGPFGGDQPSAADQTAAPDYEAAQGHAAAPAQGTAPEPSGWSPHPDRGDAHSPVMFTPEDLASPHGWEAAGAHAVTAAGEEAVAYQPVTKAVQSAEPEDDDGSPDFSSVFSEFSSLANERPKIEKTRAGLQRRRPEGAEPVEPVALAPAATGPQPERDAEAVRTRFSAFYSGTQRARAESASVPGTAPADGPDQ